MTCVDNALAIRFVALSKDVELCYAEQGNPSGLPVLFLPGATDSWRSFERVLPHLPESVRAIAVSQRGHGDSSRPRNGYRTKDFVADLVALMDVLDLKAAVIVGHSMGSLVAQRFALDHPQRTLALVLVGSFPTMRGNPEVKQLWDSAVSTLMDPVEPSFVVQFQESTLAQFVPEPFFQAVVKESLKVPARVWKAIFASLLTEDFSNELGRIDAPTLIFWGDRDSFCPGIDQDILVRSIRRSQLVVYSETGHALHWEEPELFSDDLVLFLKSQGLEC